MVTSVGGRESGVWGGLFRGGGGKDSWVGEEKEREREMPSLPVPLLRL